MNKNHQIIVDSTGDYSFFVSGHFHGSSKNTSGKPARTLLANINRINLENVSFLISLGDLFLDVRNDIQNYDRLFLSKIKFPVFNAPGNHDKSGTVYEEYFGETFYFFKIRSELFIFLDTELEDGNINGKQLQMVEEALKDLSGIKNIFVLSHRLIWAEEHPDMQHLFKDNTRSSNGNNFRSQLLPIFQKTEKNVFFLGGSLGSAPAPFFYHQEGNIHFMATAIRDTPKDAFLKVNLVRGKVSFEAFPLIMPIEFYNLDYYNGAYQKEPGFNWRLVPLYIFNMISHRYFWYGLGLILIPLAAILFYKRRKKKINR